MAKKLKVTKEDAIALFGALGFGTAKKWDVARLQKKLNALDEAPEDELGDEQLDDLLDEILSTKEGNVIVVDEDAKPDEDYEETEVEAKKEKSKKKTTKKSKKEKPAKKVKKEKPAKKEKKTKDKKEKKTKVKQEKKNKPAKKTEVKKDKFGNRKGSIAAAINAALTKRPKTMEQLQEDANVENQQNGHLKKLIEAGYAKKTDKGYALV